MGSGLTTGAGSGTGVKGNAITPPAGWRLLLLVIRKHLIDGP